MTMTKRDLIDPDDLGSFNAAVECMVILMVFFT